MTPPKTELKENVEANISHTNSTSDKSSESGNNDENSERKSNSQIIDAPKHNSLFSMDFLDDDSQDEIAAKSLDHGNHTARSQEEKIQTCQVSSFDLNKVHEERLQGTTIDNLVHDLSQDMPSSISSNHESNNQSFEEQNQAA